MTSNRRNRWKKRPDRRPPELRQALEAMTQSERAAYESALRKARRDARMSGPESDDPALDCALHGFTYRTGSVGCPDCLEL